MKAILHNKEFNKYKRIFFFFIFTLLLVSNALFSQENCWYIPTTLDKNCENITTNLSDKIYVIEFDYNNGTDFSESSAIKEERHHFGLIHSFGLSKLKDLHRVDVEVTVGDPLGNNSGRVVHDSYYTFNHASFPESLGIASLHNLHKNWDIGFNMRFCVTGNDPYGENTYFYFSSFVIAAYGYYYPFECPFERRFFIRFGLEYNIHLDLMVFDYRHWDYDKNNKFDPKDSFAMGGKIIFHHTGNPPTLSLGTGYNYRNNFLFHFAVSIPVFTNEYGYQEIEIIKEPNRIKLPSGKYPLKMYYTLGLGITWLFM